MLIAENHLFFHFVSFCSNSVYGFCFFFIVEFSAAHSSVPAPKTVCQLVDDRLVFDARAFSNRAAAQFYLHSPESFSARHLIQVKTMTWLSVSLSHELSAGCSNSMCCNPIEWPPQPHVWQMLHIASLQTVDSRNERWWRWRRQHSFRLNVQIIWINEHESFDGWHSAINIVVFRWFKRIPTTKRL